MTDDAGAFTEWVGRERVTHDVLLLERARKLAATLDRDPEALHEGGPLPAGWHWMYFHEPVRRSDLAQDGHEKRGDFLPPVPLPRRMWAGGRLRFERPLCLGEPVRRVSTIRSVVEKEGRTGPLAFVTVEHALHDADGVALLEEQDIVYLERPKPGAAAGRSTGSRAPEADPLPEWTETYSADEVTLFRFSALTFNGHRIHYDRPYATGVEGYPGIVVHGPLLGLLMLGAGARWADASDDRLDALERYEYRSLQPLFCGEPITFCGRSDVEASGDGRTIELWGAHADRGITIRGSVTTRSS